MKGSRKNDYIKKSLKFWDFAFVIPCDWEDRDETDTNTNFVLVIEYQQYGIFILGTVVSHYGSDGLHYS